jgi:hypothetical protein
MGECKYCKAKTPRNAKVCPECKTWLDASCDAPIEKGEDEVVVEGEPSFEDEGDFSMDDAFDDVFLNDY